MMQKFFPGKILIVDDEIGSMSGMWDFLSELGHQVKGHLSGREALHSLQEHRYDLLMTDLMMPEMDGMMLMKRAKEIDPLIICIMITGHATIQNAVEAMKEGAFDYITKPPDWKMLRMTVSRALEVRRLMQSEKLLKTSCDQLRVFAIRLVEAQEHERQRIARELHDGVGQNIIGLDMNLNSLFASVTDKQTGMPDQRLIDSRSLTSDIKETIRDIIANLRPPLLDDFGLLPAIESLGDKLSKRAGLRISVLGDEDMPRMPEFTEISLFRIIQEALTNVAKHAQAENVSICLEQSDAGVRLEITDDGIGFNPDQFGYAKDREAWGLLNMRERVSAINGTLKIASGNRKGTNIVVEIPR
jgi:signal transduction histidine kinase